MIISVQVIKDGVVSADNSSILVCRGSPPWVKLVAKGVDKLIGAFELLPCFREVGSRKSRERWVCFCMDRAPARVLLNSQTLPLWQRAPHAATIGYLCCRFDVIQNTDRTPGSQLWGLIY